MIGKVIYVDGSNGTIQGYYIIVANRLMNVLRLDRGPWKDRPDNKLINMLYNKNSKEVRTTEDVVAYGPSFFTFIE